MALMLIRIVGLGFVHLALTISSFFVLLGLVTRDRPRGTITDITLEIVRVFNAALIEPGRSILSAAEEWLGPMTSMSASATVLATNSLVWAVALYGAIQLGAIQRTAGQQRTPPM
jgi:hypothetical protein